MNLWGIQGAYKPLRIKIRIWILYSVLKNALKFLLKDGKWVKENRTNRHELEKFNQELRGTGETERNPKDYKRHFYYWKKNGKLETGTVKKMVL